MARFTTLYTAASGMNAAQANLYVTGHNMSNVHIPGYTRQSVIQKDYGYQNVGKNYGGYKQVGLGTDIMAIRQIRDVYMDRQYRASAASLGYYSTMYNVGLTVEQTFGELESDFKMQDVLTDLKDYISEMHNDMDSIETRNEFINACITFLDKSSDTYDNMRKEQNRLNDSIKSMVERVNELLNEINFYSKKVFANEVTGDNANDYRDKVNSALDELSQYLDITYSIKGNYNVSIFSEGSMLLGNGTVHELGLRYCSTDTNLVEVVMSSKKTIHDYDDDVPLFFRYGQSLTYVNDSDGNRIIKTTENKKLNDVGGALKALLVARGLSPNTYMDTPDKITQRYLDDKAALDDTSPTYRRELEILELQYQRDMFNVMYCTIPKTQMQLDTLVSGVVKLINDSVAPLERETVPPRSSGLTPTAYARDENGNYIYVVTDGRYTQATGYFLEGEWVDDKWVDGQWQSGYPVGQDGSDDFMPVFVRKGSRYQPQDVTEEDAWMLAEDARDFGTLFTIGNLVVNPEIRNNIKLLTISATGDAEDHRILDDLIDKWEGKYFGVDNGEKMSVANFYEKMIGDLGIANGENQKDAAAGAEELNFVDAIRLSISGVSMDEEMSNMMKFQHAYNAAARVFNYVDSMIDRIINGTGRVGL